MKTGIELIAEERQRQISVEGWTPENDDANNKAQMVYAAKTYLEAATMRESGQYVDRCYLCEFFWPESWNEEWCKPKNTMRDLVKAGALIAAEIDRLQRKSK